MNNPQLPIVSICVPVYNVENYIAKCVRSLFEQTYENIEYIFVDDCSKDNSVVILKQIVAEYGIVDSKFHLICHKHNRGLAAARNTAVDAATGDFIMHVDSDDWLEHNAVEILVNKQMETGADIVSGSIRLHFCNEATNLVEPDYLSKYEMLKTIIGLNLLHTLCKRIIRKSLYTNNEIKAKEGVNLGEDHYTLPRLVYFSNFFAKVDDVVYHYNRMVDSSLVAESLKTFNLKNYHDTIESFKILSDFFSSHNESILSKICNQNRLSYAYRVAHEYSNLDNRSFQVINSDIHRFKKEAYGHYLKLVVFDFLNKLHVLDFLVKIKKRMRRSLPKLRI